MPLGSAPRSTWHVGGAVAILLMGGGTWYALRPAAAADAIETADVTRGEFVDVLPLRGEVRARRTVPINAPRGAGELQIVEIARSGTTVAAGDVIVRFDTTTTAQQLAEKRSALREAEAEIARAQAEARISAEAARTDHSKKQYDVQRAKLDVATSEVVSRLDAEKATLTLGAAEQRTREAETKIAADAATARASLGALERSRDKKLADVRLEETRLAALTVRTPVAGVIALGMNYRAGGPFQQREWRPGDRAWAGAWIAQVPELGSLYVLGKVDESDRGRLDTGLDADVEVQALGTRSIPGRVTGFSALAKADFTTWPPARLFDVQIDLRAPESGLRPSMTAALKIRLERLPQALLVPTRALFPPSAKTAGGGAGGATSAGTPAEVFVRTGRGFERRAVRVARRGPDRSAIAEGLQPGDRVAVERPPMEDER